MRTFLLVLLTAALVSCSAIKYDWPRWRGPNGDNISKEKGWNPKALEGGPRVAWKTDIRAGYSGIAIQNNRLYAMGGDFEDVFVYCLDAATGKELWRYSFPAFSAPQATPTVEGSAVYCLSAEGLLLCLNARNGKLKWKKDLVADHGAVKPYYGFAGSPAIVGDLLILTANTSGMALDKRTGEKVWVSEAPPKSARRFATNGTEYHTPVIFSAENKQYALICSWKGVFSVEVKTGKAQLLFDWEKSYAVSGSQIADPAMAGEKALVVGTAPHYPGSVCLDVQASHSKSLWTSDDTFSELGSPVFLDGHFYVSQGGGDGKGFLRCLDPESGEVKWEEYLSGKSWVDSVSFMVADGKLVVLNDKGTLSIAEASPAGFRVISSCDVLAGEKKTRHFWTAPVLCNGRIYCRNTPGDLVCIDVRK